MTDDDAVVSGGCFPFCRAGKNDEMSLTSTRPITEASCITARVYPYFCDKMKGSVYLSSLPRGYHVHWKNVPEGGRQSNNGRHCTNLLPCKLIGELYKNDCFSCELSFQVDAAAVCTILSYTTIASTSFPWNGEVVVNVDNCPSNVHFLWNNGVVTKDNTLRHARPGTYTATIMNVDAVIIDVSTPAVVENNM